MLAKCHDKRNQFGYEGYPEIEQRLVRDLLTKVKIGIAKQSKDAVVESLDPDGSVMTFDLEVLLAQIAEQESGRVGQDEPLDHGAVVPLWFLVEAGWQGPTCLVSLPWSADPALMARILASRAVSPPDWNSKPVKPESPS